MNKNITVALVAYTCEPGRGSEYEVGWQWSRRKISNITRVVLTRRASIQRIEGKKIKYDGWCAKIHQDTIYVGIDYPLASTLLKGRKLMRTHYLFWQLLVLIHLIKNKSRYDLVHHVAFVAVWMPALAAFSGIPFIWGPLGTSKPLPKWYRPRKRKIKIILWEVVTQISPRINLLVLMGQNIAKRIIVINDHVKQLISKKYHSKTTIYPAIGLPKILCEKKTNGRKSRNKTVLFAGRFSDVKLPDLAIEIGKDITKSRSDITFIMVGEDLKERYNTQKESNLKIMSSVSQDNLWEMMNSAMVLLFPSYEGSGFVVLEALANGLPVVCLEDTGPAFFVGNEGGTVCHVETTREETIENLKGAIIELLENPTLWDEKHNGAKSRSKMFSWDKLDLFLENIYRDK